MAGRQNKIGLDYFELDCHLDEKIELIEAEYGLKGFAIVVKLYQSIYSGFGYYCEWTPDTSVLWARRMNLSHGGDFGNVGRLSDEGVLSGFPNNLINNVIAASIRRDIFSEELFRKYHILSSQGIQKRYLNATQKREKVEMKKEYLLISIPENRKNVVINSISGVRNSISGVRNAQSKEENILVYNKLYTNDNIVENAAHDSTDKIESDSKSYKPSEFELKCVDFLIQSILNDFPNQRVPKTEEQKAKWAIHINRMLRLDNLDMVKIWNTLVWTMNDSFWRTNIRSTQKFREKFQTLYLQYQQKNKRNGGMKGGCTTRNDAATEIRDVYAEEFERLLNQ